MNPVIDNEDYSWYGDERIGRTRRYGRYKEVDETSYILATIPVIVGVILLIILETIR
jgi:hypothetical protein